MILLLDGTNAVLRRATAKRDLSAEEVARDALDRSLHAARWLACTHLVACFDDPAGPVAKRQLYADYKVQSGGAMASYAQEAAKAWAAAGVRCLSAPGYEADDVVATLARRIAATGRVAHTLSSDNDYLQLADVPGIRVMQYASATETPWLQRRDGMYVEQRFGVPAQRYAEYLALVGGKNGVPGVKGIGPKKAAAMLHLGALDTLEACGRLTAEQQAWANRASVLHAFWPVGMPAISPASCRLP